MARSPVTDVVQRYNALTEVEQKVFLDLVDPQPEPTVPAKQTRKKHGPSKKAQSLSDAISKTPKAESGTDPCVYQYAKDGPGNPGMVCGELANNSVHDETMGYAGYHEFEAPKAKKAKTA